MKFNNPKEEWKIIKLKDAVEVFTGFPFKSKSYIEDENRGIKVIRGENVSEGFIRWDRQRSWPEITPNLEKFMVQRYDIVIGMDGSKIGKNKSIVNTNETFLLAQRVARLRTKDSSLLEQKFLAISVIKGNKFLNYVNTIRTGTSIPHISIKQIENYEIVLPPIQTQYKISHIISALDDKIELNRKMNQTLEEMAQALFKSWFVDFDPVHVKMGCANDEELEVAARELGISKEVLELFPSEFEESELGMIPEGWEVVKIEKILKRYKAPKRYKKDAVKSYGRTMVIEQGSDIILGYHDNDGEFKATVSEPMFIFGDHTCIMKLSTKPFSISENVIPLSGCIRNGYWTYYATYGQQTFQEYRRHWSELIVRDTVLADEAICDFFAEQVQSLILKIEQNILENNELIMTRDTLLPKLLSGELDVSELDLEI